MRLRQAVAGRPVDAPLLIGGGRDGRWQTGAMREPFRAVAKACGLDPDEVTPYALRHSSIVRQILANTPIRLVASLHDTSTVMIEKSYSRYIAGHGDAMIRKTLLDLDAAPPASNVVPLARG
jgi:hypothetical protein